MKKKNSDVYEIITQKIIDQLEKGTIPWTQKWTLSSFKNAVSKKDYRGINVLLLAISTLDNKFKSQYWVTYKQAQDLGGYVKKDSKSTIVVFWKFVEKKVTKTSDNEEEITEHERFPLLCYYRVFNIDQTEGIPEDKLPKPINGNAKPIEKCEQIVKEYKDCPEIIKGEPAYNPHSDIITVPHIQDFDKESSYYSTLFHELTHSTGSENRLDREGIRSVNYGSEIYSKEELVAAIGSSFLCNSTGIENETIENNASYINGWLKVLKNDKKFVVSASGQAQKAVDYILNGKVEEK
jgi:antirestriction protein ArdC